MRRWAETAAIGILLAVPALPFVILFPEPPAFGRGAATLVATVAILATVGTAFRAEPARRSRILRRAAILLAITLAAVIARILLAGDITARIPTADVLPRLFGLQGEDVDDAVLYEVWVELWIGCALVALAVIGMRRLAGRPRPSQAAVVRHQAAQPPAPPWNAATIGLWLVGWGLLAGAVLEGHRTAAFLSGATHVNGTIADPQPHPRIRFTTADGVVVEFTQNGAVSRPLGATVPVAYQAADPRGTARADTVWANWSDVLALLWIGLGFTLFPFFGLRGELRTGRW